MTLMRTVRWGLGPAALAAVVAASFGAASFGAASAEQVDEATLERGKALFVAEAPVPCGTCHALEDAGTAGAIGPVLHDLKPSLAQVLAAVTDGVGVMPAYAGMLSEDDIAAVSAYVAIASGGEAN
jgi:mono/diheme cytochrome c family protein